MNKDGSITASPESGSGSTGTAALHRTRFYLLLALAMLAVLLLLGCQIWLSYREDIREAETKTRNYVAILETRLDATVRRADAILQGLVLSLPQDALDQQAVPRYAARLNAELDAHLVNFEELAGLRIFDANGDLLYSWASASTPRSNISDRRHFQQLRDNPQSGLVFSEVITSRATGRKSIVAARAVQDEQGAFRGVVLAVIELGYFEKLFQTLDTGRQGLITIRRSDDFSQIVRWPPMESEDNKSLPAEHPSRGLIRAGKKEASFQTVAATDNIVRIFSIRRLERYPFYIQVALAREDVLAGWRKSSLVIAASGLLLMGLVAGLLLWLWRMELREARSSAELRESRNQLKLQFDHMPVGCIVWGRDFVVQSWNPAAERIFGYRAVEATGRSAYDLMVPKDAEADVKAVWQKIVGGDKAVYSLNNNSTKSGAQITCEWINAPFSDSEGNVCGAVSMVQDVTQRLEHEKEQLKMEKLESLGVLAGGIAHDFNNILTGIVGNISFAQMFLDAGHRACKPLAEAEKASQRAGELARQLLTFARGGEPVKDLVSVGQIVREAVSLMLRGSNVRAQLEIPDGLHTIEADEGQINQVFNNIILNASQAMPDGGTLAISASNEHLESGNQPALPAGNYVRITFSDSGRGIAAELLNKIFDPYFSTKATGTGLGLASAHSIVSRHGGNISVRSIVGQGTIFTVLLPSTGSASGDQKPEAAPSALDVRQGGSILVLDDETMILELAAEMLTHLGYQATTCADGAQAVRLYQEAFQSGQPFAAVLMDLTIPGGVGGKEAARQILALDPRACLIVSSGYSNDRIMSDYRNYGFSGAIAKPYNVGEFRQMLDSLLASR